MNQLKSSTKKKRIIKKPALKKRDHLKKSVSRSLARKDPLNKRSAPHNFRNDLSIKNKLFPIVVIGASAGGLEAYSTLLKNLPIDTGMAFVIIQHLDPEHKSLLKEILERVTEMPLNMIKDGMKPSPNNIYIINPGTTPTFLEGTFKNLPRKKDGKLHLPVDTFMRSLAEDSSHYAIGVILSGTESDGTLGMEFIKSEGGITYAQDKKTSKFFGMPGNAIAAGVVDFILTPVAIARELGRISRNQYLKPTTHNSPDTVIPDADGELNKILVMLHTNNGIDFKDYKSNTIKRRLLRRMVVHKINHIADYTKYLKRFPVELDALCEDILINVTSFFRDPEMYASLKNKVFPQLLAAKDHNSPVRAWISACSTGEEAYSMAIAISEFQQENGLHIPVQIFATDLSAPGIEKARGGIYSEDIVNDITAERLRKYFVKTDGKYLINKTIRDMCVFAKQNLIQDPPFSKMDIISCRNVLIYLGQILQNRIIPVFHYSLNPSGYLILGTAETIGSFTKLFSSLDKKNKIFQKKINLGQRTLELNRPRPVSIPSGPKPGSKIEDSKKEFISEDYQKAADSVMLEKFAPASVIVNANLDVTQFRGDTSDYLELPQGEPSFNLLKIARDGLAIEIRFLINKAIKENASVRKDHIEFMLGKRNKILDLLIEPLGNKVSAEPLFLIVFDDKPYLKLSEISFRASGRESDVPESKKIERLKKEVAASKDNLKSIIVQLESANEELRSANEEVQSSNEELQSTNEELETATEELQSTNEELTTVNDEHQNTNIDLSILNNDLNNLLTSINIPVVMLDKNLSIRRFTKMSEKLLNLIPSDIGRKLTNIKMNVEVKDLEKIVAEVIKTPTTKEISVKGIENNWYYMRVRPYLTLDNKIDGVIISFLDITNLKQNITDIEKNSKAFEHSNMMLEKSAVVKAKQLENINISLEREIVDRKHTESSLKKLSKHLANAQEEERSRVARDLHDGINQILSIAKMKLHSIENIISKTEKKTGLKDIVIARELIETTINEVRIVSGNLRPLSLEDIGLKSALQSVITDFTQGSGIKVRFRMGIIKKILIPAVELNIYRIVQEALQNIEKHSDAKSVDIIIKIKNSKLEVCISDNGKGFNLTNDVTSDMKNERYGLITMRERTDSLGGNFMIKSTLGKGTEINISIPQ